MQRILISAGFLTLACLFAVFLFWHRNVPDVLASPKIANTLPIASVKSSPPQGQIPKSELPQQVDLDAFYQTIIDNNIFRPLNWEPPQREPAYTLIGTAVATAGNTATAYIQEHKSNQFYAVTVGDQIRDATVQNITAKRVTLTTEKGLLKLSLSGPQFLNPRRGSTQSKRSYESVSQVASTTENKTVQKDRSNKVIATETEQHRMHKEGLEHLRKRANEFRTERMRMQERLQYLQQR